MPRMIIARSRQGWCTPDVLLPFSIAQNSIPLALTLRQSDFYWSFQLAPLESLGSERDEGVRRPQLIREGESPAYVAAKCELADR